jgi:Protein of unknown function (DUF1761)
MLYRLRVPSPPLSHFVENLWYYDDLIADHTREKLLPDASMELIIDLGNSTKKLAGFEWATLGIATIALFERRSAKYILINGGYMTIAFVLMGLIIGAWR